MASGLCGLLQCGMLYFFGENEKEKSYMKDYIKIARVDHWIKQLFIVPGMIFALFLTRNPITAAVVKDIVPIMLLMNGWTQNLTNFIRQRKTVLLYRGI